MKTVVGKGLPFHKKAYEFGNLYIIFKVSFPDSLNKKQVEALNVIFAGSKKKNSDDDMDASETCMLTKYDEQQRNTHAQGGTEGDSDEEEEQNTGGGQRVQCAQ